MDKRTENTLQSTEFRVSVLGVHNEFSAPQIVTTMSKMQEAHQEFMTAIKNPSNLGHILAICEPIESIKRVNDSIHSSQIETKIREIDREIEALNISGLSEIEYSDIRVQEIREREVFLRWGHTVKQISKLLSEMFILMMHGVRLLLEI